ncbi:PREDICTED: inactive protein RESTRICTED TEV MOVEMENT 1-like [Tarenaya hassleriana]|uniref:inactive protein RESTRICTED TEV MOVEMENT 1-like n=1 Tax=Tarenaya hassleriana TaxID=28532 RepID=UPI00053C2B26|nr:PREDICTED: inactive protein RESTRICTED TEV MOVEMENT 1-like [Tarenaya hassleriana]
MCLDGNRMIKVGPVGKSDPSVASIVQWDDAGRTEICQIILSGGDMGITSIQFQFFEDGKLVLSNIYGQSSHAGNIFETIELNYPDEYITGISGEYTTEQFTSYGHRNPRIRAIKFTTNEAEYGPLGRAIGMSSGVRFSFKLGKSPQFGGFHGTYDTTHGLHSIGVYLKPKASVQSKNHKVDPATVVEEQASVISLDP